MPEWNRNTPWRQGNCLALESAKVLGLVHPDAPDETAVLLVSHDCDVAQDQSVEPVVEVIVGRFVKELRGDFSSAKNLRKLHLPCTRGNSPAVVELVASAKRSIPKDDTSEYTLAGHDPDETFKLAVKERAILQAWLAARYRRAAFADEFDRRLKEQTKVAEKIAKALKDTGNHIYAVFFDVDENQEKCRQGADDIYGLTIILLYRTDVDPAAAELAANLAREKILKAFKERCFDKSRQAWQWIELEDVEVISDEAMTYTISQNLKKWQIDHISFRAEPHDVTLRD